MKKMSKIQTIQAHFRSFSTREALYQEIIRFGEQLPPFEKSWEKEENRVLGCQSLMYLHTENREGSLYFYAHSDALISKGLAALLIEALSGKRAEEILQTDLSFLEEIGIPAALTPGRANGLASLYVKIKQAALQALTIHKS